MKNPTRILSLIYLATVAQLSAAHYDVYLLGGQSNGNGRADAAQLTPPLSGEQTDVRLYYLNDQDENSVLPEEQWINLAPGSGHGSTLYFATEFGPEVSFGRAMADAKPAENIAIIKYTYGGSSMAQWSATGARYATFVSTVQAAFTALTGAGDTYELRGMLWQQGEADTGGTADNYGTNLTDLIARVRSDLNGGVAFPFVIGSLSDSQYSDITTVGSGPYKVRQAQEAVAAADPTVGIAISDGFGIQTDGIHFDHNGQVALGQGHATQMLALEGADETGPLLTDKQPVGDSTAAVDTNLVAVFNEPIALNAGGTVTIRDLGPGGDVVITIPDARLSVSGSGNEMVIDPTTDLVAGNPYAVRISADAVLDLSANAYAGIDDDTTWSFSVANATPTSLIHHWAFDGSAVDSGSTGGHDGTEQGDASYTTGSGGKFGEAVTLDGDGDSIDVGQSSLPETDFSMTAWIYRETAGDYMYVAGTQSSGTAGAFLRVEPATGAATANNSLFANLLPPAGSQRVWGGTIPLNAWTHVAMTVSSTAGLEIFINGASAGTDATALGHTVFGNFRIGARPDNAAANEFDGLIDDVAIFDGVLDSTQLANVIAQGAQNFNGWPVGVTGVFDENADATNSLDIEIPASTLGAFKASVLTAYNDDLGGVIDWETGVTATPSVTTQAKNTLTSVAAAYGVGAGNVVVLTFDHAMDLYTNDINSQVEVLSRQGSWHSALIAGGGNDPIGLAYTVAFSGADIVELGMAIPSRSTYGALGVDFRATAHYSGGGSGIIDYFMGGTPGTGDTFLHFAAPASQTITSVSVEYVDDNGQALANGQRRPVLDDLGFVVAAPSDTFATWIANPAFGLDPADQDFPDDPDGDGLSNGLEAWFGTHPGEFSAGLAQVATDGTTTTFTHPQNESPPSDLTGYYEWSPNLLDWYAGDGVEGPGGGLTVTISPNTVGPTTTVSATASGPSERLFLRAGVVQD